MCLQVIAFRGIFKPEGSFILGPFEEKYGLKRVMPGLSVNLDIIGYLKLFTLKIAWKR